MFKVALSCAVAASGILLSAGAASSRTMVVDETRGRYVECYNKEYVPARVLVNTRGRRVRGEYHEWEIQRRSGIACASLRSTSRPAARSSPTTTR